MSTVRNVTDSLEVNIGTGNGLVNAVRQQAQLSELMLTQNYIVISVGKYKKDVTPLLTHWSCLSLH